ncbi:hypothetical protein PS900_05215 [Pseudomonas fluorescens]|uniref:Uncharacterized protein n=1 Tax=Pseudomonas fluorescens TaxID=294 RepID=A0A8H2NWI4_PSEFL|nr:hypothetical protein PS900_05215 [Pseudomonas fluorescens]
MVVNDDACFLEKRVALKSIASKLAPTRNDRTADQRCVAIQINNPA